MFQVSNDAINLLPFISSFYLSFFNFLNNRSNRTVSKRRLYDSSSDDSHDHYRHRIWWDAKMRRILQHELEWQRQNMLYATATLPTPNQRNTNNSSSNSSRNNLTYNSNSTYTTSIYSSSNKRNILPSHQLHPKHGRRKRNYPIIQDETYFNHDHVRV